MTLNGQELGALNLKRFTEWASRATPSDFRELTRRGILNRTSLAAELDFDTAVFRQNEGVKKALAELENSLRAQGILPPLVEPSDPTAEKVIKREPGGQRAIVDSARLQRLEQENALLRAELGEVKRSLQEYQIMRAALVATGRIPR